MGTKKRSSGKRRRRLSVLEDYDQDGVPNFDDCQPLDPTQHGYTPSGGGHSFTGSRGRSRGGGGGSYTPSPRGGYTYTPGRGTVTRGAVLSGARARAGGYSTVYGTLIGTPMGESMYWATRGMSESMRGATIGAIEKSYRAPETLTARERTLIEPHLSKFSAEFQRKFHQAKMKVKLKRAKKEIRPERMDVTHVKPDVPGVTTSLLYAATPETLRGLKQVMDIGLKVPIGLPPFLKPTTISQQIIKAKEAWGWQPVAEREYARKQEEVIVKMAEWKRTPEEEPIIPYKLTPEAKAWEKKHKKLIIKAEEFGWETPEGIEYPRTLKGETWAREYEQVASRRKDFLTPEGLYKEEYYKPTKEAVETLKDIEWLEKRSTEMTSPVFMAKERTEGYVSAPLVVGMSKIAKGWEEYVATPFAETVVKYPRAIQIPTLITTPMISVPRYIAKKGVKRVAPDIFKPYIERAPLGMTDLPTEVKIGIVRGPADVTMFGAEAMRAVEYAIKQPEEAIGIAAGVAAYTGRGMIKEAVMHPGEFIGSTAFMMAATAGLGKVARPLKPRYLVGEKITDLGKITYRGIGLEGIKTPRPMIGLWEQLSIGPREAITQRALILGKEYPAARYIKGVHDVEVPMPELGKHVTGIGKEVYREFRIGREGPRFERMRFEGIVSKDYLIPKEVSIPPMEVVVDIPPPKMPKTFREIYGTDIKGLIPEEAGQPPSMGIPRDIYVSPELVKPRVPRTADWSTLFEREMSKTYRELGPLRLKGLLPEEAGQPPSVGYIREPIPKPPKKVQYLLGEPEVLEMGKILAEPKLWGMRVELPKITTVTEVAPGRAYRMVRGYDAFQIGARPKYVKTIMPYGLEFGKVADVIIKPFKERVPPKIPTREQRFFEPTIPRMLTEGLILDISKAKIRPTERPSPIDELYERITPEDIYREFRTDIGISTKEILKPMESRYLKSLESRYLRFDAKGELILQPEVAIPKPKPKRVVEVVTEQKIGWDVAEFFGKYDPVIKPKTDKKRVYPPKHIKFAKEGELYWEGQEKTYTTPLGQTFPIDVRLSTKHLDKMNKALGEELVSVCSGHPHPTEWGGYAIDVPEMAFRHPRATHIARRIKAMRGIPRMVVKGGEGMVSIRGLEKGTPEWWTGVTEAIEYVSGSKRFQREIATLKPIEIPSRVTMPIKLEPKLEPEIALLPELEKAMKKEERGIAWIAQTDMYGIPKRPKKPEFPKWSDIFVEFEKKEKKERPFFVPHIEPKPYRAPMPVPSLFPMPSPLIEPFPELRPEPSLFVMPEPFPEPRPELRPIPEPRPIPFPEPKPRPELEPFPFPVPPPPDIVTRIITDKKEPRRRRKKYKREEYPWLERHYIPTLSELMKLPKGVEIKTPKAFAITEMKMPKMPKGLM